jgi:hypothetical protein
LWLDSQWSEWVEQAFQACGKAAERIGFSRRGHILMGSMKCTCMDVMRDTSEFFQRSNCSDFLPPDLTEPIDKSFYIEKWVAPPAH